MSTAERWGRPVRWNSGPGHKVMHARPPEGWEKLAGRASPNYLCGTKRPSRLDRDRNKPLCRRCMTFLDLMSVLNTAAVTRRRRG